MKGSSLKRIAAKLPASMQHELRRHYFRRQIARGTFHTDEKEYALLDRLLAPGDWVLDIGANVGHYARRMSELVGPAGRVVAFEPVRETFSLLSANAVHFRHPNVTLLNVAASDHTGVVNMAMPQFDDGLANFYQARVMEGDTGMSILSLAVDALALPKRVSLAKIDVEGHELPVLRGMRALVARDRPVLVVETGAAETIALLGEMGYATERLPGSSNLLCRPKDRATG